MCDAEACAPAPSYAPTAAIQALSTAGVSNRTVAASKLPKSLSHEQYGASPLLMLVKTFSLGTPGERNCPFKGRCGDLLTMNELYTCHEYSFGVTTQNEATGLWSCTVTADEKRHKWRTLMSGFVTYDAEQKASFAYKTAFRATCGCCYQQR
eukprot:4659593-Pleurochrysis_carterae.AAC.1